MYIESSGSSRRLSALALAGLLTVALPASHGWAQSDKNPSRGGADTSFSVSIPSIEAENSSLDDDTLRAIFSGDVAGHAEELAGLDATSIRIPELRVTYDLPEVEGEAATTGEMVYRDIVITDVTDGVAASTSVGGAEVASGPDVTLTIGAISSGLFNIAGILGFYGLVPGASDTAPETVYEDFSFEGATLNSPEATCEIGAVTVAEFKARPLQMSFTDLMALAAQMESEGDTPSPESLAKFFGFYADFISAFESTPIEFDGLECSGTDDDGKAVAFDLGSMTVAGFSPGRYPEISASDVSVTVEDDGEITLGNFTMKGFDLAGPIATIEGAQGPLDDAWFEANYRHLIPAFEGIAFSDFAMDVPDEENPGERIQLAVADFDISLGNYVNGIPASIATSASGVAYDLPADTEDESLKQLLALGIERIDLGYDLALAWDEPSSTIAIEKLTFTGEQLGTVSVSGTLGNAAADLFSTDTDAALVAALGLVAKNLNIDIEDAGFAAIALQSAAAEQGQDVAQFQASLSAMAEGTTIALLGGTEEARNLGAALGSFIAGSAKSLSISIAAKDEAGLGMMDFMAAQEDPTVLISKVTIDASAN